VVVIAHILQLQDYKYSESPSLPFWASIALVGFFVHSGYLIAWTTLMRLKSPKGYRFREFLTDRTVRIYICLIPLTLIILILSICQYFLFGELFPQTTVSDFLATLLMVENHPVLNQFTLMLGLSGNPNFHFGHFGNNLPLWTLAIEWWMYLSLGWWMIKYRKTNSLLFYFLFFAFLSYPLYEVFFNFRMGPGLPLFWAVGIAVVWWLESRFVKLSVANIALSVFFLALCIYSGQYGSWQLTGFIYTIFLFFLLATSNATENTPPVSFDRIIKYLAGGTLTLYLIHFPLIGLLNYFNFNLNLPLLLVTYLVVINSFSAILAHFTEHRYKQFRSQFYKKMGWQR
jgi:peptidoglycan/LPS O-acetylase OafA/YrhL